MTRKQIYEIIEKDDGSNVWSHLYDVFMYVIIILIVVPLITIIAKDLKNMKRIKILNFCCVAVFEVAHFYNRLEEFVSK